MAVVVQPPTVDDLLAYLGLSGAQYPSEEAQAALDAAMTEVESLCVTDPFEAPLREAVLRRSQAILTARGAPLGMLDGGTFGLSPMLRYDTELNRLVSGYLKGGFA